MGIFDLRRPFPIAVAVAIGVGVLAVGKGSAQTATRAPAEIPLKFSLDSKFEGPVAPFLVAIDRGYYKANGLDVSIDPAPGAIESIARVASGAYAMGFADINALIRFRDQNPEQPVKGVFMVYNRPPFAVITRRSRGVAVPKDLEGKKLGAPTVDATFAQWNIFAHANGIDMAKVRVENVAIPVREPMLAAGQVDAIIGASLTSFIDLKDRGVPLDDILVLLMADYGVDLYGSAVIVNAKFAADKPEAVKAFLRAFLAGLKDAVRDPMRAVNSVMKRNELAKKDVEIERLRMALRDNIVTSEVRANGYGAVDMGRLERSIDQIALTHQFKSKPSGVDIFDASFLPPSGERKVN